MLVWFLSTTRTQTNIIPILNHLGICLPISPFLLSLTNLHTHYPLSLSSEFFLNK